MTTTLFVCHEGQRTGAPLLLLWLIRWLLANTAIRPVVALMRDGPLREEFSALCPTHTFSTRPVAERWHRRLRRRLCHLLDLSDQPMLRPSCDYRALMIYDALLD